MDVPRWKFWKRRRYIVTLMALLGFFNVFALRVNVSVAIVAMTSTSSRTLENGTVVEELPEFNWDSKLQGLVLGSYFYGYITTQILGGWLAARVGGNRLFGLGIGVTSMLTLLTPLLVRVNVYWFIAIRVIEGIFEGVSYPSMHDVWAHWAPPMERSRLATFAYSGSYIGTVVVMPISGVLAQNVGWPAVFYVFGVVGLVWFAAWWVLVKRGPQYDRHIDPRELKYLQDALPVVPKNVVHPWKKFFASGPVWAVIVANFSENWGFYTLLTQLPIFMKDTLEFDIQEAGFLSALPYVVVSATMQVAGHIADWFLSRKILNTTQVRKLFCCGAFLCQSLFMLLAAFLLTPAGAVTCLTLAVGLGAFAMAGFFVNHLDIAPQHASVLLGIGNTFGTMPGIISPTITGYIVQHKTTSEWQIVFFISSAIYLVGSIFYGIFASGEVQSWAKTQQSDEAIKRSSLDGHSNKALET
ncbi:vesicular glutamate transporter 1 isoform X2 [Anabrus simplex]